MVAESETTIAALGEVRLIDWDHPALVAIEILLDLEGQHSAALGVVGVVADQDQIGKPGPKLEGFLAGPLDLGPTIEWQAVDGVLEPEDVESQPWVLLKEGDEFLMECTWHIWDVGLRRIALQGISSKLQKMFQHKRARPLEASGRARSRGAAAPIRGSWRRSPS